VCVCVCMHDYIKKVHVVFTIRPATWILRKPREMRSTAIWILMYSHIHSTMYLLYCAIYMYIYIYMCIYIYVCTYICIYIYVLNHVLTPLRASTTVCWPKKICLWLQLSATEEMDVNRCVSMTPVRWESWIAVCLSLRHASTHTHRLTHIDSHTSTHTHRLTHIDSHTSTHTQLLTVLLTHLLTNLLTHLYAHTSTHTHRLTHIDSHIDSHTSTHTPANKSTHTSTYKSTHTHLRTHILSIYSHTSTHTHRLTPIFSHTSTPTSTHTHLLTNLRTHIYAHTSSQSTHTHRLTYIDSHPSSHTHLHRKSSLHLPLSWVNLVLKLMGTPDGISTRSRWNRVSRWWCRVSPGIYILSWLKL